MEAGVGIGVVSVSVACGNKEYAEAVVPTEPIDSRREALLGRRAAV